MLVATDWRNESDNGRAQEVYGTDALGNTIWRRNGDGGSNPQRVRFDQEYEPGLGRLRSIESVNEGHLDQDFYPEMTTRRYDPAGNLDWAILSQMGDIGAGNVDFVRDKRSRSYYGADERLRYFQERDIRRTPDMGTGTPELEGVWEEYRYDPLGRRVLVNTRTKDLCTTGTAFRCASATTRMVWAGDQLIWEIRQASQSTGEESSTAGSYGTVSYTHAGGIDRPLVITKGSTSILPHQNWRGLFSSGTYTSGARSDCLNGATTNCHLVAWPGWRTTAWHAASKEQDIRTWWGGLVDGMRDASGQMYMRNRYYDPATGQFTQPDPIALAGGLNSYGFAAGDPVSYSDPYGLCPQNLRDSRGRCPGGLSVPQYNSIEASARDGLTGAAQTRILSMLESGDIRLVGRTGNGQPAGAAWRGRSRIQVTAQFFSAERPNGGNGTGYGSSNERAWVLGHELGHILQAEAGMLLSEVGTGVQPNRRRIGRLLDQAGGDNTPAQVDANRFACSVARDPGAWGTKPGCTP